MTNKQQEEWRQEHISQALTRLSITRKEYKRFLIVGNKLHRAFELNCNGYVGNEAEWNGNELVNRFTEEDYTRLTQPLYKQAQEMAKEKGLYIYFQTDPRGATIYLDTKEIPSNNYTNAVCIY